jgi:hypothetical protein
VPTEPWKRFRRDEPDLGIVGRRLFLAARNAQRAGLHFSVSAMPIFSVVMARSLRRGARRPAKASGGEADIRQYSYHSNITISGNSLFRSDGSAGFAEQFVDNVAEPRLEQVDLGFRYGHALGPVVGDGPWSSDVMTAGFFVAGTDSGPTAASSI